MKKLFKLMAFAAIGACLFSCGKEPVEEQKPEEPKAPKVIDVFLEANPEGDEALTTNITVAEGWTVAPEEDCDWASVTPASGTGAATLSFTTVANETDKERSIVFVVKEVSEQNFTLYEIMITQPKKESNVADGDLAFLKAIVEGNMLGEDTPTVENWYVVDAGAFAGITLTDKEGKLYIERIDGAPLTDFPTVMHLSELNHIHIANNASLTGKRLPADWDTPKLVFIRLTGNMLTGPIPAGLAASPVLVELYMDQNDFFGALPHDWASTTLKVVILANINNKKATADFPQTTTDNAGLGYMVPASLDVLLNNYNDAGELDNQPMYWHDKTQFKLGGVFDGNYVGFEQGWGQGRYEKYDAAAVAGDKTVWSDHRLLIDDWAWYFSNVGFTDMLMAVPHEMKVWDQTAADAYTKKCEDARK